MMAQLPFLIGVAVFVLGMVSVGAYFWLRARRLSRATWKTLLGRLQKVDREKLAAVALDLLEARQQEPQLMQESIFNLVGGMEGLEAIGHNCDVLIDIAAYVQRWYPEAGEIAEELRLNAREIKWHIGRLRGAKETGHFYEQFPIYAQRAVATYYLMTRSLLMLYEGGSVPGLRDLQQAL